MHRHCRLLTQKQIFSQAYYYKVVTSGNTLKCHIISDGLWLPLFTDQSVYFYIPNSVEIINPVEFANEHKLLENHDLTGQPVITDIYMCVRIYASCLS